MHSPVPDQDPNTPQESSPPNQRDEQVSISRDRRARHAAPQTERETERREEEHHFTPVIIKRNDQTKRHPDDTLQFAIEQGVEQLRRPTLSLLLASVAAGLMLIFTVMAVATMTALFLEATPLLRRAMAALVYPLGFIIVLLSGNELFTEHTAMAVFPVLDRRTSVAQLLRLWGLVLLGNLLGAAAGAGLLAWAEPVIQARAGYIEIGHHLVGLETGGLFASALLAGWLMAAAGWLILATPSSVVQLLSIYIATFLIGLGSLQHSIAGSVEIFAAKLMAPEAFGTGEMAIFISVAVVGNIIGGALFVAILNHGHIRHTRSETGKGPRA